jgi:hypothetical protein
VQVDKSVEKCPDPVCHACQMGKARRWSHTQDKRSISSHHGAPGAGVSADQMEVGYPGHLPTISGLPSTKHYKYVNIWVDHFTHYIYPMFHESKDLKDLLASKTEFETFSPKHQVNISSICADNGVYAAAGFKANCDTKQQKLTLCAVSGHRQNEIVEQAIGSLTNTVRTLLLHTMAKWPGTVTEEFWPFTVCHNCSFHNACPRPDAGLSPHQMFMGSKPPWQLQDFRIFGSPVYVLDKHLQDGDSLPRWKAWSWIGVYVGQSLVHVGNVPVVYNPVTTHISPQFHVVYDEQFTSISRPISIMSDQFFKSLYDKASWTYESPIDS